MLAIPTNKNYSKNLDRSGNRDGNIPCIVCGKGMKADKAKHWVHVFWGNTVVMPAEAHDIIEREGAGGDTGHYPVGPDCLREYPELRAYVNQEGASDAI